MIFCPGFIFLHVRSVAQVGRWSGTDIFGGLRHRRIKESGRGAFIARSVMIAAGAADLQAYVFPARCCIIVSMLHSFGLLSWH